MILGIGNDIVEVERIRSAIESPHFGEKYFTVAERGLFQKKPIETIAGNFCAKEAVAKALGTGFHGFFPRDIEVLRDPLGKPYVNLYEGAFHVAQTLHCQRIHVSITHTKAYAVATVVLEG